MLTKLLSGAGALTAALWMTGTAHAVSLTFTDIWDPVDVHISRTNPTYTFTHDILDNGFNPLEHVLNTATLTLDVRDDDDDDRDEQAIISLDGLSQGSFEIDFSDLVFSVDVTLLQDDGKLVVTFNRVTGDFLFRKSTLVVDATSPDSPSQAPAATPEPSTLILLGSGLAGVVGLGRRRRQKAAPS